MNALEVFAGPTALRHLRAHGLRAQDVAAIPAAAGGPKGLVLNPLDRYIFGEWLAASIVLYPHFQKAIIPGWLDKALKYFHRATEHLDNVVVVAPHPDWVATLPDARLPDRNDFVRYGDEYAARVVAWTQALAESERLRDEFAALVAGDRPIAARPL